MLDWTCTAAGALSVPGFVELCSPLGATEALFFCGSAAFLDLALRGGSADEAGRAGGCCLAWVDEAEVGLGAAAEEVGGSSFAVEDEGRVEEEEEEEVLRAAKAADEPLTGTLPDTAVAVRTWIGARGLAERIAAWVCWPRHPRESGPRPREVICCKVFRISHGGVFTDLAGGRRRPNQSLPLRLPPSPPDLLSSDSQAPQPRLAAPPPRAAVCLMRSSLPLPWHQRRKLLGVPKGGPRGRGKMQTSNPSWRWQLVCRSRIESMSAAVTNEGEEMNFLK